MKSVLQDWVMELPLREQGTLLTGIRGCDLTPKLPLNSIERQLVGYLRYCVMNPADPREIGIPGAFFQKKLPDFKISALGHYPLHWVLHIVHAFEVIGYRHPDKNIASRAFKLYHKAVYSFHMRPESLGQMATRLSEDRIANGSVVS